MKTLTTAYFVGVNVIAFTFHAEDKAVSTGWLPFWGRIPEIILHQVELAGGSTGSFLAQRVFRHKISKLSYQRGFSQILIVQVTASLAWGYFLGPSWVLAGAGLAPTLMLAATARRIGTLKDRQYRGGSGGYGNRWNQPWQKPVDTSAPANVRRNTLPKSGVSYK
ncbi:unnamed protein product [Pylaiella littoralis]